MIAPPLTGRTVLAIFAHPDDESLACGGTLARLADEGARIVVVTASHGELGGPRPMRDPEIAALRVRELCAAASALGIAEIVVGDHPDGDLQWSRVSELHAELVALIRRHRPVAIITFGTDGLYWHADHIGMYERTTTAVALSGADPPPLYHVTMRRGMMPEIVRAALRRGWVPPQRGFWSLTPEAFGMAAEPPTITIDVGPWVPRKLRAILCHRSQLGEHHPLEFIYPSDARRLLGFEYFHRAPIPTNAPLLLEQLCV